MFSKVKFHLSVLLLTLVSLSSFAQSNLPELRASLQMTLENLRDPQKSNLQRLQIVQQRKELAEEAMRLLIMNGAARAEEINNPQSEVALSFKLMDQLTVLSQLRLHANSDQATDNSCIEAQGMLRMISIMPISDTETLDPISQHTLRILELMCRKIPST